MTRIPYSEELKCDENQYNELLYIVEYNSRVKIEVGLCKGKKLYDKRETLAKKEANREVTANLKYKQHYLEFQEKI